MGTITRIIITIFILLSGSLSPVSILHANQKSKVAVFYPEVREPYKTIYQEILQGVKTSAGTEVIENVLPKEFDVSEITQKLEVQGIKKVIVLGRAGYQLAKKLPADITVVSGALPIHPNGISGISLISDPGSLFYYLKQVAPEVARIHVAYSQRNEWLIELAKQAAIEHKLELNAKQVESTGDAIAFYNQLFDSDISNVDAIWLPLDKVSSHDKVTLPLILEKAWSKEVPVFSSKPSHAKRGALFSTYPDNVALGSRLAIMVNELADQSTQEKFAALKSLQLAVNLRTAAHLGLKYSDEQLDTFKVTFPE
ncbi:ABC transporter substrate binding protein [Aliikangiella sp. G2MR2-5]|uniref:ABC transporter substrate binding protein n=1 Tax=Aliikangiella sp. G2MR2-5 TaxID=2788943 RepID=UPI0018A96924|nr:ABC transporter substrate binding protein [Aliikangiella sp. G2MR2-5]